MIGATAKLFGLEISTANAATTVAILARAAAGESAHADGRSFLAGYVNPHTIDQARTIAGFRDELRAFDLLYPDGIGLVWAARFLGVPLPERVTASDFLPDWCRAAAAARIPLFFLGGQEGVADAAARELTGLAPGLSVAGARSGYFAPGAEEQAVVEQVRASGARALLVGMGSPRQERWILANARALGVPLVWAVGGAFDFYSGHKRRAPKWVQALGVEWLFRMAREPRRLWRRYLLGNARFAALTIAERVRSL